MDPIIRPTVAADIPRLQQIEQDAAQIFRGLDLIDVDDASVAGITEHLRSIDEKLSLVAEVGERIAGFAIGEMEHGEAYLHELDVDRAFQKRGVGAGLVRAFADAARAKGASAVVLSTFRTPPWNAPFYARVGFVEFAKADYLPWMTAIEAKQASFLDLSTRVWMRLKL